MTYSLQYKNIHASASLQGAELISLRDESGMEYIWEGDPAWWPGRNPILFPIVGGLRGGQIKVGDTVCSMRRHGFARDQKFTVMRQGEDFIEFQLKENAETLQQYPFPFVLTVRHQIREDGFTTSYTIRNSGEEPLPFCIGAHPAFRCPQAEGEVFEDYQLIFDQPEDTPLRLMDEQGCILHDRTEQMLCGEKVLNLNYDLFQQRDTLIFSHPRSQGVSLRNRKTGRGIYMTYKGFTTTAFWTKPGAPFLCLEPWQGFAAVDNESGQFTDKPDCAVLPPKESRTYSFSIQILKGEN